jgi:hypothetical protein
MLISGCIFLVNLLLFSFWCLGHRESHFLIYLTILILRISLLHAQLISHHNNNQVKGFVTKMEECMGACDCIITKVKLGALSCKNLFVPILQKLTCYLFIMSRRDLAQLQRP